MADNLADFMKYLDSIDESPSFEHLENHVDQWIVKSGVQIDKQQFCANFQSDWKSYVKATPLSTIARKVKEHRGTVIALLAHPEFPVANDEESDKLIKNVIKTKKEEIDRLNKFSETESMTLVQLDYVRKRTLKINNDMKKLELCMKEDDGERLSWDKATASGIYARSQQYKYANLGPAAKKLKIDEDFKNLSDGQLSLLNELAEQQHAALMKET